PGTCLAGQLRSEGGCVSVPVACRLLPGGPAPAAPKEGWPSLVPTLPLSHQSDLSAPSDRHASAPIEGWPSPVPTLPLSHRSDLSDPSDRRASAPLKPIADVFHGPRREVVE